MTTNMKLAKEVSENVRSFVESTVVEKLPAEDNKKLTATDFVSLQVQDYSWRVNSRKKFGWVLVGLLIVQNIVVFSIVVAALISNKMQDLQVIFAVLVSTTLGETAYMVKVIIEWLFREINYPGN